MTLQSSNPASFSKRIVAGVIDYAVMVGLLWMPLKLVLFGDIDAEIEFTRTRIGSLLFELRVLGLWFFPYCLHDVFRGRGLGKWLVGIKVVDAADLKSVPSAARLILRNVTIWFSPVGLVTAYVHPDRMRFGDRLAHTVVVEDRPDPMTSPWGRRLLKALVLIATVACCVVVSVWAFWRYVRGSRPHEAVAAFVEDGTSLRDFGMALSLEATQPVFARCHPTADGALARLVYGGRQDNGTILLDVVTQRERPPDAPWRVASLFIRSSPKRAPGPVARSKVHELAVAAIEGYQPLHQNVSGLESKRFRLVSAGCIPGEEDVKAYLAYGYSSRKLQNAEAHVLLSRGQAAQAEWQVEECSGIFPFSPDNAGRRQVFVFAQSKDLHRYLTDGEISKIFRERMMPADVIPELKEDNQTVPPAPSPDNTTAPPAQKPTGTPVKPSAR